MFFVAKILISALIIATVSELGKKLTWIAAILASLPLVSVLALIWLYIETKDVQKIISLSNSIFWAVLPSLLFFVVLPIFLKSGTNFSLAMLASILIMVVGYGLYIYLLTILKI